jgi:hypothetical protein
MRLSRNVILSPFGDTQGKLRRRIWSLYPLENARCFASAQHDTRGVSWITTHSPGGEHEVEGIFR